MKCTRLRGAVGVALVLALVPGSRVTFTASHYQAAQLGVSMSLRQVGAISGTVWNLDDSPVADARLRLRDVTTGLVVAGTETDALGRFTFIRVLPGSYVVELVDDSDHVRALGHVFSLGPAETVVTFIRLGSRVPWYDGFFSNAAAAAIAAASSLGVTALGEGAQPASARS